MIKTKKNDASGFDCVKPYAGFRAIFPDTTDEGLFFRLPEIKILMTLVVSVHDSGLTRPEYLADKGAFISFALREKVF